MKSDLNHESTKWITPKGEPQGVALIIHGLNMRPSKMGALSQHLVQEKNISVLQVALKGHIPGDDQESQWQNLTETDWPEEAYQSYCLARQTAQQKNLPLYLVGYSLGGALLSHLLLNSPDPVYEQSKLILLAPALSLPWYASMIKLTRILGPKTFIPSFNIEEYQAFKGTTVAGYNALFSLVDTFRLATHNEDLKKLQLPTLILMDPQDELVSYRGLDKMIRERKLSQWKIHTLDNSDSHLQGKYHHLIVDPSSLGPKGWGQLTAAINTFISPQEVLP